MLYAILCYDDEAAVCAWTKTQDEAVMERLGAVQRRLADENKLGPVARLVPTTAAVTLRKGREELVLDGPFAETKEQLLGFYIVDMESLDEAVEAARELARANPSTGAYEIRPISIFLPTGAPPKAMSS